MCLVSIIAIYVIILTSTVGLNAQEVVNLTGKHIFLSQSDNFRNQDYLSFFVRTHTLLQDLLTSIKDTFMEEVVFMSRTQQEMINELIEYDSNDCTTRVQNVTLEISKNLMKAYLEESEVWYDRFLQKLEETGKQTADFVATKEEEKSRHSREDCDGDPECIESIKKFERLILEEILQLITSYFGQVEEIQGDHEKVLSDLKRHYITDAKEVVIYYFQGLRQCSNDSGDL